MIEFWGEKGVEGVKNGGDYLRQLRTDYLLTDNWKKTTDEACENAGETFIYFQVQFLFTPAQQKSSKDREK